MIRRQNSNNMLRVEVQLSFKREGKEFQKVGLKAILVKKYRFILVGSQEIPISPEPAV